MLKDSAPSTRVSSYEKSSLAFVFLKYGKLSAWITAIAVVSAICLDYLSYTCSIRSATLLPCVASMLLGCVVSGALGTGIEIFLAITNAMENDGGLKVKSWSDLFPHQTTRLQILDVSADEAFLKCLAALSQPLSALYCRCINEMDAIEHSLSVSVFDKVICDIRVEPVEEQRCRVVYRLSTQDGTPLSNLWGWALAIFASQVVRSNENKIEWKKFSRSNVKLTPSKKIIGLAAIAILAVGASVFGPVIYREVATGEICRTSSKVDQMSWDEDGDQAHVLITQAINKARQVSAKQRLWHALEVRGCINLRRGLPDEAIADLNESLQLYRDTQKRCVGSGDSRETTADVESFEKITLAEAYARKGDFQAADALLEQVLVLYERYPAIARIDAVHFVRGLMEYKKGHREAARAELARSSRYEATKLQLELSTNQPDDLLARASRAKALHVLQTWHQGFKTNHPVPDPQPLPCGILLLGNILLLSILNWKCRVIENDRRATS